MKEMLPRTRLFVIVFASSSTALLVLIFSSIVGGLTSVRFSEYLLALSAYLPGNIVLSYLIAKAGSYFKEASLSLLAISGIVVTITSYLFAIGIFVAGFVANPNLSWILENGQPLTRLMIPLLYLVAASLIGFLFLRFCMWKFQDKT